MSEKIKVGNAEVDKANYDYFSLLYSKMPKEYVVADLVSKCENYDELYKSYEKTQIELQQKENIIKEVREKVDNFDVFKEFTFPLMKRDEEQQVKSSIDYEWRKSIKEPILEILEKENNR